jgi:hypothetical protein
MSGSFENVVVDGQTVIIPTLDEWQKILESGTFDGVVVFSERTKNSVCKLVSFVREFPEEFRLGLYSWGASKRWFVLPLFSFCDDLQRVQIEKVRCGSCSWEGRIANPTEPTLYMGLVTELETTRRAHALPRRPCPVCKSELPRPAIWTELKEENRDEE